jgi:hypothetical protein
MPQTLTAVDYATHRFDNGSPQSFCRPSKGTTRPARADEKIRQDHLGTTFIKIIRLYLWLVNGLRAVSGRAPGVGFLADRAAISQKMPKDCQKIAKKFAERPVLG